MTEELARRLRVVCAGHRKSALAARIGVTERTINRWLSGDIAISGADVLRLLDAIGADGMTRAQVFGSAPPVEDNDDCGGML